MLECEQARAGRLGSAGNKYTAISFMRNHMARERGRRSGTSAGRSSTRTKRPWPHAGHVSTLAPVSAATGSSSPEAAGVLPRWDVEQPPAQGEFRLPVTIA
jgi:hypothetical protein